MLTIENGLVLKGSNLDPVYENILIDDGVIIEISKEVKEGRTIDASGCIVSPSFLNAHVHIGDSIIKDEGDGLSLSQMVKPPNGIKHKALENAEPGDIVQAMKSSMKDMLSSGTTHFIDYREGGVEGVKLLRKASCNLPINPIILGRDNSFYGEDPDMNLVKRQLHKLLKYGDGVGLSGFGEISAEVSELISSECAKHNKISSIHTAESINAQNKSIEKTGLSEIQRAVDSSLDQVVHCTNPVGDDIKHLKEFNTSVVLCPRANATLNVGIPPIDDVLCENIHPLIGSDNIMLNAPNIMRDLEFSLKLARAYYRKYFNPKFFFEMATTNIYKSKKTNPRLYDVVGKTVIEEGSSPQLTILRKLSKNPYLSIINRTETKNILYVMNKNTLVDYSNNQNYND